MARQYYYLVAGLPDLYLEVGSIKMPDHLQFKADIGSQLHPSDRVHWLAMYSKCDNHNLLSYLKDDTAEWDTLGNFTQAEFEDALADGDSSSLPVHIQRFIKQHCTPVNTRLECHLPEGEREGVLLAYFYEHVAQSKNKFVKRWFEFDRQSRNMQSALLARQFKREVGDSIIGDDAVSHALRHSLAADFGLKGEMEWVDGLLATLDNDNMVDLEWNLDRLRVDVAQEINTFEYFTLDRILELAVLMQIADRWQSLSDEVGAGRLKMLVQQIHHSFISLEDRKV